MPKVYFEDTGLRNAIAGNFSPPESRADFGAIFENAVFAQLTKKLKPGDFLKFWRSGKGAEVDFIIEHGREAVPIEVKSSPLKTVGVSRSFRSFINRYSPPVGLLVSRNFWGETLIDKTKVIFLPAWSL